jgi:hypothetical protein
VEGEEVAVARTSGQWQRVYSYPRKSNRHARSPRHTPAHSPHTRCNGEGWVLELPSGETEWWLGCLQGECGARKAVGGAVRLPPIDRRVLHQVCACWLVWYIHTPPSLRPPPPHDSLLTSLSPKSISNASSTWLCDDIWDDIEGAAGIRGGLLLRFAIFGLTESIYELCAMATVSSLNKVSR